MLKFLTHKLRTHSLNEEIVTEKVEERDSGTESDDEAERVDAGDFCTDVIMKWNDVTDISANGERCACAPAAAAEGEAARVAGAAARLLPTPEPDHLYDHHSSEEELEVINGAPGGGSGAGGAAAAAAGSGGGDVGGGGTTECRRRGASSPPPAAPEKRKWPAHAYHEARAPSSDDDDIKVETPVRFRTSPPLEALKPGRAGTSCACAAGAGNVTGGGGGGGGRSPRRRRVAVPPARRHRPALDFDKMQQLKVGGVGGVRSWRAVGGAHGGELSVFCW